MFASFIEDQKIIELKKESESSFIIIMAEFKNSIYNKQDFLTRLKQATGCNWQLEINEQAATPDVKSINQQKSEALEKRKKDAINGLAVQRLLNTFRGAEITNVSVEITE